MKKGGLILIIIGIFIAGILIYNPIDEGDGERLKGELATLSGEGGDLCDVFINSCGYNNWQNNTIYCLNQSIETNSTCFEINQNNLVLDLLNYKISQGSHKSISLGIKISGSGNTIVNGKFSYFTGNDGAIITENGNHFENLTMGDAITINGENNNFTNINFTIQANIIPFNINNCNNQFKNITLIDKKLLVFNGAVNIIGWDNNFSQMIFCNADYSNVENIQARGYGDANQGYGYGIYLIETDFSNFNNIFINKTSTGLYIDENSSYNNFTNFKIKARLNSQEGFNILGENNQFYNITSINYDSGLNVGGQENNFTKVNLSNSGIADVISLGSDSPFKSICLKNYFNEIIGYNHKPVVIFNKAVNLNAWDNNFSELIFCNADYSNITNLNFNGNERNFISIIETSNLNFENSIIENAAFGIFIINSSNNIFKNISFNLFQESALSIINSNNNLFDNIVSTNADEGMAFVESLNNKINHSILGHNLRSLMLQSTNNTIINNLTLYNSTTAITLTESHENYFYNLIEYNNEQFISRDTKDNYFNHTFNESIDIIKNISQNISLHDNQVILTLNINNTGSVNLNTTLKNSNQMSSQSNKESIKSVVINLDGGSKINLTWANLKITYEDYEIPDLIDESTIQLYYYNSQTSLWELVEDSQINTTENYVLANITHLSEYGLFGIIPGFCGDNFCDDDEDCDSCSADCDCPPDDEDDDDDDDGSDDSDDDGNNNQGCTPFWACVWGPCINKTQNKICEDVNNCGSNLGKPEENKTCLIESNCTDQDGDGYGAGPDCVGEDLDDTDISITDIDPVNIKNKIDFAKLKEYVKPAAVIIGISILIIFLIFLLILFFMRKSLKKRKRKK